MSCCGQKREAAASVQRPSPRVDYPRSAPSSPRPAMAAPTGATVTLRFRRGSPTVVLEIASRVREGKVPELSINEARERAEREAEKRRHHFRRDGKAA